MGLSVVGASKSEAFPGSAIYQSRRSVIKQNARAY